MSVILAQPWLSKKANYSGQHLLFSSKICVCVRLFLPKYSPIVSAPPTPCIGFKLMMRTPRCSSKLPNFIPGKLFTIFENISKNTLFGQKFVYFDFEPRSHSLLALADPAWLLDSINPLYHSLFLMNRFKRDKGWSNNPFQSCRNAYVYSLSLEVSSVSKESIFLLFSH